MSGRLSDYSVFFREFLRNFHTTGAILPSGRGLSRALTQNVCAADRPRRLLEVGPGTGAVTKYIAEAMGPEDRLDLVEINRDFAEFLRTKIADERSFQLVKERVTVMERNVMELAVDPPYDLIISGLPLNNFSVADVESILAALTRNLRAGGTLSFFEYIGVRKVKASVSRASTRARLRGIERVLSQWFSHHETRYQSVWGNVPPARVHHVRAPMKS